VVEGIRPVIKKDEVRRLLGGGRSDRLSPRLERRIEEFISEARRIIKPRVVYTTASAEKAPGGAVALDGETVLESRRLGRTLADCDAAAVFVGTIGPGIDRMINALAAEGRVSDACVLDAVGSAAVEETVEKFHRQFDSFAERLGGRTTLRFSPGYCDWRVEEQRKLFGVLGGEAIGVELTPSCLMRPRKSVSGVFGIGDAEAIDREGSNPCRRCGMRGCAARRAG